MGANLQKMIQTIPKIFAPGINPVITALLTALADSDDTISQQIQNAHDQNFVKTASGQYLDRLANSLGVQRPPTLGMSDDDYRQLVPNLSLKPKQIKKAFYDTADVFWGPLFSRANLTSLNVAPYNVSPGDVFQVSIDGQPAQSVKVHSGDIATPGSATATEIVAVLNRITTLTASVLTDTLTSNQNVNIRTNTPGSVGSVQVLPCTMVSPSKLNFLETEVDILDLPQRVCVYNLLPNELIIEIPSIIPSLRRILRGSHHFHSDGTLAPPVPPSEGIWEGSFLFSPTGANGNYTLTSQKCVLQTAITKGDVLTSITVDSTALIQNPSGFFTLNFGLGTQELPIRYRGVPNSRTILIDPSYVFANSHSPGEEINVLSQLIPHLPRTDGTDLPVYVTSPSSARQVVQGILDTLQAAGIVITFVVLAPKYRYILDNPYLPEIEPAA